MFPNRFFSLLLLSFAAFLFLLGLLLVVDGITRLFREIFKKPQLKPLDGSKISSAKIDAADRAA